MSSNQRRKGVRFPWQTDADMAGETAESEAVDVVAAVGADTPTAGSAASAAPVEMPVPEDFVHELVRAMRTVAEQQRDEAIARLRTAVAEQTAGVRTAAEARAADLRQRADVEIAMIGDWERLELERIQEEGVAKTAMRRQRLEGELATSNAEAEAAQEAADRVIASFQASIDNFFATLESAADPVAFASAAMRMPQPPVMVPLSGSAEPEARKPEPVPWPDETASVAKSESPADAARPAKAAAAPKVTPVSKAAPAPRPAPVAAEAPAEPDPMPEAAAEAAPEAAGADDAAGTSTQIVVNGLTSFGAITSFKQSLERVEGIRRVSLGLGTAGEFIFTAVHPESFDMSAAIRTFEAAAEFHVIDDRLSVTVGVAV